MKRGATLSHWKMCSQLENIQLLSYRIKIAGPCEYCGALLLKRERISARGYKLVTPCCGNGKVVFLTMIY
jgi:hypothetical protein